ncbi:deoxyribose-phosphate aldolase [Peribacillus sp. SCS-37]|uniref:deoxyribose-phosphate aldolase n=1 Tax=Paraperibacillus esterisolvens TaxID=3115296 RepID=UPI0039063306
MKHDIAKLIDHTALKPQVTEAEIRKLCQEARDYGFFSVCVNPAWVALCADILKDSEVKVCTVIGFPLGAATPETKSFETADAVKNGAGEVDMVINIGALRDKNDELVLRDIKAVVDAAGAQALTKVIIETSLLTQEEKVRACELAVKAGASFVKTSTGFSTGGAVIEDIELMRKTVGPDIGVKASGGIRSTEDALRMVKAGANRIGASAGPAILSGLTAESDY